MNRRYAALLILTLLGSSGCGESPQQKSAQPPAAESKPAQPESAMAVRPGETPTPPPTTLEQPLATTPAPAAAPSAPPPAAPAPTTAPATAPAPTTPAAPTAPTAAPSVPASGNAAGTLLKESDMKEKPFIDAATLAKLPAQAKVTILERNGGWFRVKTAAQSGWIRMLNVKVTEGAENLGSGTDLTQAATLATGRAGTGNVVSTSGLRGLSEETLQKAQPDYAQFDKLNSNGVDKNTASSYAKSHGLTSHSVQYLPAPTK